MRELVLTTVLISRLVYIAFCWYLDDLSMRPGQPRWSIIASKYWFYVEKATMVFGSSSNFHTEFLPKPTSPGSPSQPILHFQIEPDRFPDRPPMLAQPRPSQAQPGQPSPGQGKPGRPCLAPPKPGQHSPCPARPSKSLKYVDFICNNAYSAGWCVSSWFHF